MGFVGATQKYILAETMEERIAVMMVQFYELWRVANGPEVPLDMETCRKFIRPAVWKEALVCAHGYLHHMKDEVTMKVDHKLAHDIMLHGRDVEEKLKLEHL
jgi:hypothetical protein